ncbi:hypothetical protein M0R04_15455 [Candidatus Dojkabacteria bacterium]|jgi:hypothetical protein|nr:hypothetical protein [Candidatus Dojkabacteria bacterium]
MDTKEILRELQRMQEKARAINKISNYIQKVKQGEKKDSMAYFIHRICESVEMDSGLSQELLHWSLEANSDLFMDAE